MYGPMAFEPNTLRRKQRAGEDGGNLPEASATPKAVTYQTHVQVRRLLHSRCGGKNSLDRKRDGSIGARNKTHAPDDPNVTLWDGKRVAQAGDRRGGILDGH